MKGGENVAEFEQLYEENQGFIYKFLLSYCRDASLAEELSQETFFKAYMNFQTLKDPEKAPSWLCRIAKNTYFAWYHQQKRICSLDAAVIRTPEDLEEMAISRDLSSAAMKCLQELEQPYKEVLMLSVFGNVSLKQISQLFGKSESWARVTFYRAKQKILDNMEDNYEL